MQPDFCIVHPPIDDTARVQYALSYGGLIQGEVLRVSATLKVTPESLGEILGCVILSTVNPAVEYTTDKIGNILGCHFKWVGQDVAQKTI